MRGHNRAAPIRVAEKVITAFNPQKDETGLATRCNEFRAGDPEPGSCGDGDALDSTPPRCHRARREAPCAPCKCDRFARIGAMVCASSGGLPVYDTLAYSCASK